MAKATIDEFKKNVEAIPAGTLKAYGDLTSAPRGAGGWRDTIYKETGLEFKIPIHRVSSKDDPCAAPCPAQFRLALRGDAPVFPPAQVRQAGRSPARTRRLLWLDGPDRRRRGGGRWPGPLRWRVHHR